MALLSFGPIIILVLKSFDLPLEDVETWNFVAQDMVPGLLWNTLKLVLGVGFFTTVLGVGLASLTVYTNLPFKKVFDFLFIIPISFPLYVLAFIYVGMLEYSGFVPTFLRENNLGYLSNFMQIKSSWGVIFVFTLGLYPYVYLLAKNAFLHCGQRMIQASRSLGTNPRQTFFKVIIPYSLPWILTGTSLAVMEALADFGGVSVFNYDTFTTAIYVSWTGLFSVASAARLSCFLILFALLLYFFEYRLNLKAKHVTVLKRAANKPLRIFTWRGKALTLLLSLSVVMLTIVIPLTQLLAWLWSELLVEWSSQYLDLIKNTFFLGLISAFITATLAFLMVVFKNRDHHPLSQIFVMTSLLGYALPGSIIAVAVFLYFRYAQDLMSPVAALSFSPVVLLIIGYMIRYLSVSYRAQNNALKAIHPNYEKAAKTLGAGPTRILKEITFPLMSPAFFSSMALLFIEVIKEMPMTLMLRPFGMNTLAVKIYELTSEGEWERASVAATFILLIGVLGTFFIGKIGHDKN